MYTTLYYRSLINPRLHVTRVELTWNKYYYCIEMSGERVAIYLGAVYGAAELVLSITTEMITANKSHLVDLHDPLMVLPFVTNKTAVTDILPNESHQRGSIYRLLD